MEVLYSMYIVACTHQLVDGFMGDAQRSGNETSGEGDVACSLVPQLEALQLSTPASGFGSSELSGPVWLIPGSASQLTP
jgi:hypothetical protein